jgi:phosphoribosyl-AMP cyclohydrolase
MERSDPRLAVIAGALGSCSCWGDGAQCGRCSPAAAAASGGEMSHEELEQGATLKLDFQKLRKVAETESGVIPCCVQHADTKEVLIIAYVNEEALTKSIESKVATFWSTSRNELWVKGLTSGDYLDLTEIRVNCEQNSVLYLVRPAKGGVCHSKGPSGQTRMSCYYRTINSDGSLAMNESADR